MSSQSRTQVTRSSTGRHRRPADDVAGTDLDPRPGAVCREWSWHDATSLRDATTFWGRR